MDWQKVLMAIISGSLVTLAVLHAQGASQVINAIGGTVAQQSKILSGQAS